MFCIWKDDKKLEEAYLQLYEFSRSYPNPEKWLQECVEQYEFDSLQAMAESEFVEHIMSNTRSYMKDLKETIVSGLQVCDCEDGPYMYRETLEADLQDIEKN